MFHEIPWPARPFNNQYRCYSISMFPGKERAHIEKGGKIIMPPSALDQLSQLNISYPMLFKLTNNTTQRVTHCGVLEFVAEEGKVYMPYWMMQNLLLQEGDLVRVETATLPRATFTKFQVRWYRQRCRVLYGALTMD
jgi:ubiquitin fusion degradation protein 1